MFVYNGKYVKGNRKDVHDLNFREMTTEQLQEESLIDIGFAILEDRKNSMTLPELFEEIQKLVGYSNEQMAARKPQFYTDMNIDGRFLAIAENQWGLREWYPVEQIEEETAPTVKVRKKKAKVAEDELDDLEEIDEDEIIFEEEFDEFIEDDDEDEDEEDVVIDFEEAEIDEVDVIEEDLIDEEDEDFEIIDDEELEEDELEEEE